jgi:hypothetical protein
MATLQDLEIGDEVTVTRSRLRDPSSRQATTDQIRGTVASVDGAGLTIIGGQTGKRYTLPVDEVVGIAIEDMVYPRLRAEDRPATLIRVYAGAQQADALAAFQQEARELAKEGYHPVSQSWAQGQWGCGAWLVALVLCLVLIGLLVFVYMLIVKPAGTLSVTYMRNPIVAAPTPEPAATPAASGQGSIRDRLAQLDEMHGAGVVTEEEYAAKRAKILDEI